MDNTDFNRLDGITKKYVDYKITGLTGSGGSGSSGTSGTSGSSGLPGTSGTSGASIVSGLHSPVIRPGSFIPTTMIMTTAPANVAYPATADARSTWIPFYPTQTFAINSIATEVTALIKSASYSVSIYSDSSGAPNTLLYQSSNFNQNITGLQTVQASFTFSGGTEYWLGIHTSNQSGFRCAPIDGYPPIAATAAGALYYAWTCPGATVSSTAPVSTLTGTNIRIPYIMFGV